MTQIKVDVYGVSFLVDCMGIIYVPLPQGLLCLYQNGVTGSNSRRAGQDCKRSLTHQQDRCLLLVRNRMNTATSLHNELQQLLVGMSLIRQSETDVVWVA